MSLSDDSNEYFFNIRNKTKIPAFADRDLEKIIKSDKGFLERLYKLFCSDVYIGNSGGWEKLVIRARCAIFRKITVSIRPGKVTKASGYFSRRKIGFSTIVKNFISNKFFRNYVLVADNMDAFYCSLAYGFSLDAMLVAPSPKVYLINYLLKRNSNSIPRLLIAPTHRRGKNFSPLEKLLSSKTFVEKIEQIGFRISYSIHADSFDIDLTSNDGIDKFDGDWSCISAVLTDYSSIGADFELASGRYIEYYIQDKFSFETTEGFCEFFDLEISKHSFSNTPKKLEVNLEKKFKNLSKNNNLKTEKSKVLLDSFNKALLNVL
ncbi:hypothetical protein OAW28_05085 [Alphaproteobacteria bacterium]|nr:hypothetical protein [Alphaproteobacteria bacterium]